MIECDFLRDSQQSDLMENIIRVAVVPHLECNLHFAQRVLDSLASGGLTHVLAYGLAVRPFVSCS
jgi:hypothetical protein